MAELNRLNLVDLRDDLPATRWIKDISSLPQSERDDIIISFDSNGAPRSRFRDDHWHMAGIFLVNNTTKTTLNFTILDEGFRETAKILLWETMHKKGRPYTLSTLHSSINSLSGLSNSIKAIGGYDWTYIESDDHYADWKSEMKSREYSVVTLSARFFSINNLHQYGLINRSIPNAKKLAKDIGVDLKQILCLPEQIATVLYANALSVVKTWHPHATAIKNASADYLEMMASDKWVSMKASTKKMLRQQLKDQYGLPDEFTLNGYWTGHNWLTVMCYLVIAGFTGMRYNEIASATKLAYHEKPLDDDNVIPYVHSMVTKTNGGVPKEADWVTIPETKMALELWHTIYEPLRERHRKEVVASDWDDDTKVKLFREIDGLCVLGRIAKKKKCLTSYVQETGNFNKSINKEIKAMVTAFEKENKDKKSPLRLTEKTLAEFNELNPDHLGDYDVGDVLPYTSHMSRRTLAVFILRNRLGTLIDLKHQFKHLNIYMTQWYTNGSMHAAFMDLMLSDDFREELRSIHVGIQTDVVMGFMNEDILTGKKGKEIMAEREQDDAYIKGDGQIYITRAEVKRRIEHGILSVVDLPFGYCTNATCSRICNGAQSTRTCAHEVITKAKAEQLIPHYEHLIRKFERRNNSGRYMPALLAKDQMDIKALQQTFTDLSIEFEHYKPIINSNNKSIVMSA